MKKLVLTMLLTGLAATPAIAQDQTPNRLTGFSATALVGWDNAKLKGSGIDEKEDDFLYGIALGYDIQTGGVILGVEGEYSDSAVSQSYDNILGPGTDFEIGAGRDLYAGVRVGLAIDEGTVVYAKGGYTAANVDAELSGGGLDLKDSAEMDGYRLGLGLEYEVAENFALRTEYRYSDYGEFEYLGLNTGVDVSRHQLAVGLTFRP